MAPERFPIRHPCAEFVGDLWGVSQPASCFALRCLVTELLRRLRRVEHALGDRVECWFEGHLPSRIGLNEDANEHRKFPAAGQPKLSKTASKTHVLVDDDTCFEHPSIGAARSWRTDVARNLHGSFRPSMGARPHLSRRGPCTCGNLKLPRAWVSWGGQTLACRFSFRVVLAFWLHWPSLGSVSNCTGVARIHGGSSFGVLVDWIFGRFNPIHCRFRADPQTGRHCPVAGVVVLRGNEPIFGFQLG
jgi:hypothetical protein